MFKKLMKLNKSGNEKKPESAKIGGHDNVDENLEEKTEEGREEDMLEEASKEEVAEVEVAEASEEESANVEEKDEQGAVNLDSTPEGKDNLESPPEREDNIELTPESEGDIYSAEILELLNSDDPSVAQEASSVMEILKSIAMATPASPVSLETFDLLRRGMDYDHAVAEAYSKGEIAGRNTSIDKLVSEKSDSGDGIRQLKGRPESWSGSRCDNIFDLALSAR